jgi:hypothetical protein
MSTPEVFLIPTGAVGVISARNGSMRGGGTVEVDVWGNPSPAQQAIVLSSDLEGNVKDIGNNIASKVKAAGWWAVAFFAVVGIALIGIGRIVKR